MHAHYFATNFVNLLECNLSQDLSSRDNVPYACAQPYHPVAVAAMDSCFALVGADQHGIAVGSMRRVNPRIRDNLVPRRVQALL